MSNDPEEFLADIAQQVPPREGWTARRARVRGILSLVYERGDEAILVGSVGDAVTMILPPGVRGDVLLAYELAHAYRRAGTARRWHLCREIVPIRREDYWRGQQGEGA